MAYRSITRFGDTQPLDLRPYSWIGYYTGIGFRVRISHFRTCGIAMILLWL